MQRIDDRLIFSPSDLNHFLECEHLIQLERRRDPHAPRAPRDAHAELLAEKGAEHERAWLDRFRADGKAIVTIESDGHDRNWAAVSDFLVRVERMDRRCVGYIFRIPLSPPSLSHPADSLERDDKC